MLIKWQTHVCDVCRLLDNDNTEKKSFFCEACQAWICESDQWKMTRRARAMLKMKGELKDVENTSYDSDINKYVGEMTIDERLAFAKKLKDRGIDVA